MHGVARVHAVGAVLDAPRVHDQRPGRLGRTAAPRPGSARPARRLMLLGQLGRVRFDRLAHLHPSRSCARPHSASSTRPSWMTWRSMQLSTAISVPGFTGSQRSAVRAIGVLARVDHDQARARCRAPSTASSSRSGKHSATLVPTTSRHSASANVGHRQRRAVDAERFRIGERPRTTCTAGRCSRRGACAVRRVRTCPSGSTSRWSSTSRCRPPRRPCRARPESPASAAPRSSSASSQVHRSSGLPLPPRRIIGRRQPVRMVDLLVGDDPLRAQVPRLCGKSRGSTPVTLPSETRRYMPHCTPQKAQWVGTKLGRKAVGCRPARRRGAD